VGKKKRWRKAKAAAAAYAVTSAALGDAIASRDQARIDAAVSAHREAYAELVTRTEAVKSTAISTPDPEPKRRVGIHRHVQVEHHEPQPIRYGVEEGAVPEKLAWSEAEPEARILKRAPDVGVEPVEVFGPFVFRPADARVVALAQEMSRKR